MFGSIFNTYYGAPILCCVTTVLRIFCYQLLSVILSVCHTYIRARLPVIFLLQTFLFFVRCLTKMALHLVLEVCGGYLYAFHGLSVFICFFETKRCMQVKNFVAFCCNARSMATKKRHLRFAEHVSLFIFTIHTSVCRV